jgi:molybdopterin converting factor subunit 1
MVLAMRILFFAQLRDATGCEAVELTVTAPLSAAQLWAELIRRFPALSAHQATVRLARNLEYAPSGASFAAADEVALIPPVSGG